MTEITPGSHHVAKTLLELLGLGKTALDLAVPDDLTFCDDSKNAAGRGNQGDLTNLRFEGR
jgi:hypothetical protein